MCWVFLISIRFLSRNYLSTINVRALHCYANAATPHYPTVELRVFRGLESLGFMLGATLYRILDTLLARIIRIMLESFLIRAGIQDPRSKIPGRDSWAILDLLSWIRA